MSVQGLRQNNPARTEIWIRLRDQTSDADLAGALEQNPFVTDIVLDFDRIQQTDWESLMDVIATRANLEKVTLQDTSGQRNAPAALVRSFLRAMQQNTAIQSVEIRGMRLPTDISTFVDNMSSIKSLSFCHCDFAPTEREQGTRSLAVALQRNTNIETLELRRLDDFYSIPILEGLRFNTSLTTFIYASNLFSGMHISEAMSHAIQQILECTTSIWRFEFTGWGWGLRDHGDRFRPIARAITDSACVSELKVEVAHFGDGQFEAGLRSILQNKRNLTSLCLHGSSLGGGQVREDIISMISRPDSPLRCLEFQACSYLERELPRIGFEALLQAIQKSKLKRFKIEYIQSQQHLQTLMQSIPSMHIRELEVSFRVPFAFANPSQNLLLAMKDNFSLRSVKGEIIDFIGFERVDLFGTAEDKKTLAFYANRNEFLDQWVDNPETVEQQNVWPEALSLAERAGPNGLFRGLRSVLERNYVKLPGGRKRKRPRYYTPA